MQARIVVAIAVLVCALLSVNLAAKGEGYVEVPTDPFITHIGSTTTQGDSVMNADSARSTYGVDGGGIKIGLISDSFNGSGTTPTVATQISNGDLPGTGNPNGYTTGVTVVKDSTGTDEGRAMLEIVHDVAPGAELYFHSAFNNGSGAPSQTIADAIDALVAQNVDIIVDDVGILTQARFQDGAAAQAVDAAQAAGVAYFSSAGNSSTNATRATYTGGSGGTVNWGTNDVLEVSFTGSGRLVVQWTEPYETVSGSVSNSADFSVDITDTTGGTTHLTINNKSASGDPYEFVSISGPSGPIGIRVNHLSGSTDVDVQVSTFNGFGIIDADDTNEPTVNGHAAASGAVAVAAMYWNDSGLDDVEYFSSVGPTEILFDSDGNAISETRQTPILTAPDGVSTTTSGFSSFYGTSAAAPHAAAVAALVLERADDLGVTLSVDDLVDILNDSAVDIETVGFDNLSGWGRIDALAAVESAPEPSTMLILGIGALAALRRRRAA